MTQIIGEVIFYVQDGKTYQQDSVGIRIIDSEGYLIIEKSWSKQNYNEYLGASFGAVKGVRGVFTLKNDVKIINGTGTLDDPYILGK